MVKYFLFLFFIYSSAQAQELNIQCKYDVQVRDVVQTIDATDVNVQEYTAVANTGVQGYQHVFYGTKYPFGGRLEVLGRYSYYRTQQLHGEIFVNYVETNFWGYHTRINEVKSFDVDVSKATQGKLSVTSEKGDIQKFNLTCDLKPIPSKI